MSDHIAAMHPTAGARQRSTSAALPAGLAQPLLAHAALLGIAGDVLLRDGPRGAGFPLWIGLCAVTIAALTWRAERNVPRETAAWLAFAVLFASGLVWRESGDVQRLDALAAIGSLALAAVTLSRGGTPVLAARLRDTIANAITPALAVMRGIVPLAVRELFAPGVRDGWMAKARPAVRGTLIVAVLLGVFGTLLVSADPIFASLVSLPDIDVELLFSHVILIGFFAWITGGLAIGALEDSDAPPRQLAAPSFTLGTTDVTTGLVTLNALFALFIVAQLGWLFGGEQFLHERTGLTAAQYARQGFFQMVCVVMLVLPLLLATRALLAPGRAAMRRYTLLAIPTVVLLGAIIVSAALRMQLYVHYYGLTLDRFDTLVFMGWLGFVLAWFAVTVLRGRERPFMAGAMLSALAVVAVLNVIAPDRIVARQNVARNRGPESGAVDLAYLARLGGEAAEVTVAAVVQRGGDAAVVDPADRCLAARRLLRQWGPTSMRAARFEDAGAWRTWNAGERSAARVVGQNSAALRDVVHATCPAAPATTR